MRFPQEETNCQMTYIVTYARETQMIPSENMFTLEIQHSDWEIQYLPLYTHVMGTHVIVFVVLIALKHPLKKSTPSRIMWVSLLVWKIHRAHCQPILWELPYLFSRIASMKTVYTASVHYQWWRHCFMERTLLLKIKFTCSVLRWGSTSSCLLLLLLQENNMYLD